MIRFSISKTDGTYLDHGDFNSEAEAKEFYAPRFRNGVYGKDSSTYEALVSEYSPEVLDQEGNVLEAEVPAVYETVNNPAEFITSVSEIVPEVESYADKRKSEYAKIDSLLLEALAEQAEGRPEKMEQYLILREQIKEAFPKE